MLQFWFAVVSGWSGQIVFERWIIGLYNVVSRQYEDVLHLKCFYIVYSTNNFPCYTVPDHVPGMHKNIIEILPCEHNV